MRRQRIIGADARRFLAVELHTPTQSRGRGTPNVDNLGHLGAAYSPRKALRRGAPFAFFGDRWRDRPQFGMLVPETDRRLSERTIRQP
jgi:hypothetical protein